MVRSPDILEDTASVGTSVSVGHVLGGGLDDHLQRLVQVQAGYNRRLLIFVIDDTDDTAANKEGVRAGWCGPEFSSLT